MHISLIIIKGNPQKVPLWQCPLSLSTHKFKPGFSVQSPAPTPHCPSHPHPQLSTNQRIFYDCMTVSPSPCTKDPDHLFTCVNYVSLHQGCLFNGVNYLSLHQGCLFNGVNYVSLHQGCLFNGVNYVSLHQGCLFNGVNYVSLHQGCLFNGVNYVSLHQRSSVQRCNLCTLIQRIVCLMV